MKNSNQDLYTFLLASFLFICTFLFAEEASAQEICFCYRGEWSSWRSMYEKSFRYNDGSGFGLKNSGGTVFFSFQISNYVAPTKAQRKAHLKSNQWYEYTGYVEYYVSDEYPTAQDIAKANELVIPNARYDATPKVKRRAYATIKIAPYKKNPYCYNLFFDNIGIGFGVQGMKYGDYKME